MFLTGNSARRCAAKRPGLAREIALMLLAKMVLLYGIWWAFFSEPQLPDMIQGLDPSLVAQKLASPASANVSSQP